MKSFSLVLVLGAFIQWSSGYSPYNRDDTSSVIITEGGNFVDYGIENSATPTEIWQQRIDAYLKSYIVQNRLTRKQAENDFLHNHEMLEKLINDFSATECDLKQFLINDFEKLNEENFFLTEWQQILTNNLLVVINHEQVTVEDLKLIVEINVQQWATNYNVEVSTVHKFLEQEITILEHNELIRHVEVTTWEEVVRKEIVVLAQNKNSEIYELQKEILSNQQKLEAWAHSLNIQVSELQNEIKALCQRIQSLNVQIEEQVLKWQSILSEQITKLVEQTNLSVEELYLKIEEYKLEITTKYSVTTEVVEVWLQKTVNVLVTESSLNSYTLQNWQILWRADLTNTVVEYSFTVDELQKWVLEDHDKLQGLANEHNIPFEEVLQWVKIEERRLVVLGLVAPAPVLTKWQQDVDEYLLFIAKKEYPSIAELEKSLQETHAALVTISDSYQITVSKVDFYVRQQLAKLHAEGTLKIKNLTAWEVAAGQRLDILVRQLTSLNAKELKDLLINDRHYMENIAFVYHASVKVVEEWIQHEAYSFVQEHEQLDIVKITQWQEVHQRIYIILIQQYVDTLKEFESVRKQILIRQYNENVEKYTRDFLNEKLQKIIREDNGIATVDLNEYSQDISHVFYLLEKLYSQIDININNLTNSQATVVVKKEYLRQRTYDLRKINVKDLVNNDLTHADDLQFAQQFYEEKLDHKISEIHEYINDLEVLLSQISDSDIELQELKNSVYYIIEHTKEYVKYIKKLIDLRNNYNSVIETINEDFIKIGQNTLNKQDLAKLYKLSVDDLEVQLKKYEKHHYEYVLHTEWQQQTKDLLIVREERFHIERKLSAELNNVVNDARNDLKQISTKSIAIFEVAVEKIHIVLNDLTSKFKDKTLEFTSIIDLLETERARLNDICINIDMANIDIEKQLVFDSEHLQSLAFTHHISYETLVKWERKVLDETLKSIIKKLVIQQKTENERHIHELVDLYKTLDASLQEQYETKYVQQILDINEHVVNDIQEKFEKQVIEVDNSKSEIYNYRELLKQGIDNLKDKVEYFNKESQAFYKSLIEKNVAKHDLEFIKTAYKNQWNAKLSEIQHALQELELHFDQLNEQSKLSSTESNTFDYEKSDNENILRELLNLQNQLSDYQKVYNQGISEIKLINKNIESVYQNQLSKVKELEKLLKNINQQDLEYLSIYELTKALKELQKYQEVYETYINIISEINDQLKKLLSDRDAKIHQLKNIIENINNLNVVKKEHLEELNHYVYNLQEQLKEHTSYSKSIDKLLNESLSEYKIKVQQLEVFYKQSIEVTKLLESERTRLTNICTNVDVIGFDIDQQLTSDSTYLQNLSLTYHISYEVLAKWERQVLEETLKTTIKKIVIQQKAENEKNIYEIIHLYETLNATLEEQYKTKDVQQTPDINEHVVNDIQEKFESHVHEVHTSKSEIEKYREELQQGIAKLKYKIEQFNSESEAFYKSLIEKNIEKHDLEFIKTVYQREWDTELSKIQHALQELELNLDLVNQESKLSNTLDKEILENEKILKELIKVQHKLSLLRQQYNAKVSEIEQINTKIENIYLNKVPKVRQLEKLLNNIVHEQDLDYLSIYELKEALKALEKYQEEYETYIKEISDINNKLKQLLDERNAKYSEIYNIIDSVKKYNILKKKYLEDLDHFISNLQEQLKEHTNYKKSIVTLINESLSEHKIKVQQLEVFYKQSIEVTKLLESERTRLIQICTNEEIMSIDIDQQLSYDSQHLQNLSLTYHISYEVLAKWERQVLEETLKTTIKKIVIQQKAENEKNIYEIIHLYETLNATLEEQYKTKDVQQTLDINEHGVNDIQEKFESHVHEAQTSKSDIHKYREELQQGIVNLKYKIKHFNSESEAFYQSLIEKNIEKHDLEFIKTVYQSQWNIKFSEIQHALKELELNFEHVNEQSKVSTTASTALDQEISENEKILKELIKVQNQLSHLKQQFHEKFSEIEQINTKIENIYLNDVPKVRQLEKLLNHIAYEQDLDYLSIYELKEALKDLQKYQYKYATYSKLISEINSQLKELLEERNTKIYDIYNIIDNVNHLNVEKNQYLKELDHFINNLQGQHKENIYYKKSIVKLLNESLSEYKIKVEQLEVFYKQSIEVTKLLESERIRLVDICTNGDIKNIDVDQLLTYDSQYLENLSITYHISYEALIKWEKQALEEVLKELFKTQIAEQKAESKTHLQNIIELYNNLDKLLKEQDKNQQLKPTDELNEYGINVLKEEFTKLLNIIRENEAIIPKYRDEITTQIHLFRENITELYGKDESAYKYLTGKQDPSHDLDLVYKIYQHKSHAKISQLEESLAEIETHFKQVDKSIQLSEIDEQLLKAENAFQDLLTIQQKLTNLYKDYDVVIAEIQHIDYQIETIEHHELTKIRQNQYQLEILFKNISEHYLEDLCVYELKEELAHYTTYQSECEVHSRNIFAVHEKVEKLQLVRYEKVSLQNDLVVTINESNGEKLKYIQQLTDFLNYLRERRERVAIYKETIEKILNYSLKTFQSKVEQVDLYWKKFYNEEIPLIFDLLKSERIRLKNVIPNINQSGFKIDNQIADDRNHVQNLAVKYDISYEVLEKWERQELEVLLKEAHRKVEWQQKAHETVKKYIIGQHFTLKEFQTKIVYNREVLEQLTKSFNVTSYEVQEWLIKDIELLKKEGVFAADWQKELRDRLNIIANQGQLTTEILTLITEINANNLAFHYNVEVSEINKFVQQEIITLQSKGLVHSVELKAWEKEIRKEILVLSQNNNLGIDELQKELLSNQEKLEAWSKSLNVQVSDIQVEIKEICQLLQVSTLTIQASQSGQWKNIVRQRAITLMKQSPNTNKETLSSLLKNDKSFIDSLVKNYNVGVNEVLQYINIYVEYVNNLQKVVVPESENLEIWKTKGLKYIFEQINQYDSDWRTNDFVNTLLKDHKYSNQLAASYKVNVNVVEKYIITTVSQLKSVYGQTSSTNVNNSELIEKWLSTFQYTSQQQIEEIHKIREIILNEDQGLVNKGTTPAYRPEDDYDNLPPAE